MVSNATPKVKEIIHFDIGVTPDGQPMVNFVVKDDVAGFELLHLPAICSGIMNIAVGMCSVAGRMSGKPLVDAFVFIACQLVQRQAGRRLEVRPGERPGEERTSLHGSLL